MTHGAYGDASLRRIWDRGVRRGERLTELAPTLKPAFEERNRARISARTAGLDEAEQLKRAQAYKDAADRADAKLDGFLEDVGRSIDVRISQGVSGWTLREGPLVAGKQTWRSDREINPSSYFEERIAEQALKTAFRLRSPARSNITEALKLVLKDRSPKLVYRSDIQGCFESIPHAQLLSILSANRDLPRFVMRQVEELLKSFRTAASTDRGVPRGVGLSSSLAEIYLREVDRQIELALRPTFHSRFVDDSIIVVNPAQRELVRPAVRTAVREAGLKLSPGKTLMVDSDAPRTITFLGYRYVWRTQGVTVEISTARFDRYKSRLALAFDAFVGSASIGRQDLLLKRLRFLTSNYRLTNNKRQALAGIYFSNSLLDEPSDQLRRLDQLLAAGIAEVSLPARMERYASKLSFVRGFHDKKFVQFSPEEYRRVTAVWRNG